MKKTILTVITLLSLNAISKPKYVDPCQNLRVTAEAIMEARQGGVDVAVVIKKAKEESSKFMFKNYMSLIKDAYSLPAKRTGKFKEKEVSDFGERHYIICWTGVV